MFEVNASTDIVSTLFGRYPLVVVVFLTFFCMQLKLQVTLFNPMFTHVWWLSFNCFTAFSNCCWVLFAELSMSVGLENKLKKVEEKPCHCSEKGTEEIQGV